MATFNNAGDNYGVMQNNGTVVYESQNNNFRTKKFSTRYFTPFNNERNSINFELLTNIVTNICDNDTSQRWKKSSGPLKATAIESQLREIPAKYHNDIFNIFKKKAIRFVDKPVDHENTKKEPDIDLNLKPKQEVKDEPFLASFGASPAKTCVKDQFDAKHIESKTAKRTETSDGDDAKIISNEPDAQNNEHIAKMISNELCDDAKMISNQLDAQQKLNSNEPSTKTQLQKEYNLWVDSVWIHRAHRSGVGFKKLSE